MIVRINIKQLLGCYIYCYEYYISEVSYFICYFVFQSGDMVDVYVIDMSVIGYNQIFLKVFYN